MHVILEDGSQALPLPAEVLAKQPAIEEVPRAIVERTKEQEPYDTGEALPRGDQMFERFTEKARDVVVYAEEESRTFKHNYLGTEHLLLALLRDNDSMAATVLHGLLIDHAEAREKLIRIVGMGVTDWTNGQIPLTPRAKKVLQLALREALSLGHTYIGTEHILLGIVRENEGVAARMLLEFGPDADQIRNEVLHQLSGPRVEDDGISLDTIKTSIAGCARCDVRDGHEDLVFMPFTQPVRSEGSIIATHWCLCPTVNEPILLARPEGR